MLFNSTFRNIVTLLCITEILYAVKFSFRGGGGEVVGLGPLFLNFLDPPLYLATFRYVGSMQLFLLGLNTILHRRLVLTRSLLSEDRCWENPSCVAQEAAM